MKKIWLLSALISQMFIKVNSQESYWQQKVDYKIQVTLNDQQKTLKGQLHLQYTNQSPDTLTYIWFHIWPNAYKNEQTALFKQFRKLNSNKNNSEKITYGWIDSLQFKINGNTVKTEAHPEWNDVIKLPLSTPLLPGNSIKIETPFFVKLPSYFSRSGFDNNQFMICQWYPKPAVYDRKGWHAMPYLDQGEFYSEYGNFEVSINIPSSYVVGATGALQQEAELQAYKKIGNLNLQNRKTGKWESYHPASINKTKTLTFKAENVHDFAWFANKDFIIQYDTLQLKSGKTVDVFSYKQPNGNPSWRNSTAFIKDAAKNYSNWIGEYPYPVVQAVEGPVNSSSGGMEYPMITLITSPDADEEGLDAVITHEIGHNWFYGILGSNERQHPWMDEGLNTYFEMRYEAEKYRSNSVFGASIPIDLKELSAAEFLDRIYGALNKLPSMKGIIDQPAAEFKDQDSYATLVYLKTSVWFYILENMIMKDVKDQGIQTYFEQWKFKHPYPEDMQRSLEAATGKDLKSFFELLKKEESF